MWRGKCFRIVDSLFSQAHRGKEPSRITRIFSFSHPPTSLHQQHQLRNAPTYLLLHVSPSLRSSLFSLATSCSPLATPISTLPICVAELKISSSLTLLSYPRPRLSIHPSIPRPRWPQSVLSPLTTFVPRATSLSSPTPSARQSASYFRHRHHRYWLDSLTHPSDRHSAAWSNERTLPIFADSPVVGRPSDTQCSPPPSPSAATPPPLHPLPLPPLATPLGRWPTGAPRLLSCRPRCR